MFESGNVLISKTLSVQLGKNISEHAELYLQTIKNSSMIEFIKVWVKGLHS